MDRSVIGWYATRRPSRPPWPPMTDDPDPLRRAAGYAHINVSVAVATPDNAAWQGIALQSLLAYLDAITQRLPAAGKE